MYSATGVDPTKLTAATSGSVSNVSTATRSPLITLNTPGGKPASVKSSANRNGHDGSFSDGFNTKVFPHAIAMGNIQSGTIAGKLNGVIPAHTPTGARSDHESMSPPTVSEN